MRHMGILVLGIFSLVMESDSWSRMFITLNQGNQKNTLKSKLLNIIFQLVTHLFQSSGFPVGFEIHIHGKCLHVYELHPCPPVIVYDLTEP